mmetsp:Transcript_6297/g.26154  ORF Transcript_6297/g.26154 Transcript_6297/m.26154 type:complete len:223 (-) Transcript_6297:2257-2925(-)
MQNTKRRTAVLDLGPARLERAVMQHTSRGERWKATRSARCALQQTHGTTQQGRACLRAQTARFRAHPSDDKSPRPIAAIWASLPPCRRCGEALTPNECTPMRAAMAPAPPEAAAPLLPPRRAIPGIGLRPPEWCAAMRPERPGCCPGIPTKPEELRWAVGGPAPVMGAAMLGVPTKRSVQRAMWSEGCCGLGRCVPHARSSSSSLGIASTASGVMFVAVYHT